MARVVSFRVLVMRITQGDAAKALTLDAYLNELCVGPEARPAWRTQVTRAMDVGGPLREIRERKLVLPDKSNRCPRCFR